MLSGFDNSCWKVIIKSVTMSPALHKNTVQPRAPTEQLNATKGVLRVGELLYLRLRIRNKLGSVQGPRRRENQVHYCRYSMNA